MLLLVSRLTVAIGVAVGASTAVLLLTIVSCVCCPWCPLNRWRLYYSQRHLAAAAGASLAV